MHIQQKWSNLPLSWSLGIFCWHDKSLTRNVTPSYQPLESRGYIIHILHKLYETKLNASLLIRESHMNTYEPHATTIMRKKYSINYHLTQDWASVLRLLNKNRQSRVYRYERLHTCNSFVYQFYNHVILIRGRILSMCSLSPINISLIRILTESWYLSSEFHEWFIHIEGVNNQSIRFHS